MRTIPKERILRVNCPGFGVNANFNLGSAKPLNEYSAIVVNPVSIAHLFDKDPEVVRRIDKSLEEGHTTFTVDDDMLLRNIAAEAESRILELSDFLTQGGFLIYFLARPFLLKSNSLAVDNYLWLETLAPDQPVEPNVRHMSAVAQGRLVEVTEKGSTSDLAPYLRQPGLEWNTIIRDELLTDGYHLLATAGPNKCIAGQLFIMQSNGRVAFLPAPFSPDFDKTLLECINNWYVAKEATEAELEAEAKEKEEKEKEEQKTVDAPESGPQFFQNEQSEVLPPPDLSQVATQATASSSNSDLLSGSQPQLLSEEEITSSVVEEAKKFEESLETTLEKPKEEEKKPEIDLSIFSKTARQLVQSSDQAPEENSISMEAPVEVPTQSATSDAQPTSSLDAVDSSIAGKIASDLTSEALKIDTPEQPAPVPKDLPEEATTNQIATPADGEKTVTNNDNQQDQERKQKAMEALRELQQSHPQAAPPAQSQPTPPGLATPPAQAQAQPPAQAAPQPAPVQQAPATQTPASSDQNSKPLLNTLFKKDAAPQAQQAPAQASSPAPAPAQQAPAAAPTPTPAPAASQAPAPAPVQATAAAKPAQNVNLPVPAWCQDFSFSYLDDLRQEQSSLSSELANIQAKLNTVESRIASVEQLKQALLAGEPGVLIDACNTVLSRLGWAVSKSPNVNNEVLLANVDQPEALARMVRSDEQCGRTEVAQLAESAIAFWDEHEIEPKGVLVACTWASISPEKRAQPDFSDSLRKFAEKKNLCLMTAMQLLGVYRDIELGTTTQDVVRKQILETNGQLQGFEIEKGVVGAAV